MILVKTETGMQVMKDRSITLSPRQRSAFILFDGKRTLEDVLAATAATGVTREDVEQLVSLGLLSDPSVRVAGKEHPPEIGDTIPMGLPLAPQHMRRPPRQRFAEARPIAMQLTSELGSRGVRLVQAVESASSYDQLLALAPRIREAVGPEKFLPLGLALHDA